jgi:hypothetical protein
MKHSKPRCFASLPFTILLSILTTVFSLANAQKLELERAKTYLYSAWEGIASLPDPKTLSGDEARNEVQYQELRLTDAKRAISDWPELLKTTIIDPNSGQSVGMTGQQVADFYRQRSQILASKANTAAIAEKNAPPGSVISGLRNRLADLQTMLARVNDSDGYLQNFDDINYKLLYNRPQANVALRKSFASDYQADGKTMPNDLLNINKDLIASADALKAAIDRRAVGWSYPKNLKQDASAQALTSQAIVAQYPGIRILASGMENSAWIVNPGANGYPLGRYKTGVVLAQMAGEKWLRQFTFSYSQNYTVINNSYQPARVNINFYRFQKGH